MAAIDIVGRTVVVTAAGTLNIPNVEIISANVWWATTAGDIVIDEGTHGIPVRRFTPDGTSLAPFSEWVSLEGKYGILSISTCVAATLTFTLG